MAGPIPLRPVCAPPPAPESLHARAEVPFASPSPSCRVGPAPPRSLRPAAPWWPLGARCSSRRPRADRLPACRGRRRWSPLYPGVGEGPLAGMRAAIRHALGHTRTLRRNRRGATTPNRAGEMESLPGQLGLPHGNLAVRPGPPGPRDRTTGHRGHDVGRGGGDERRRTPARCIRRDKGDTTRGTTDRRCTHRRSRRCTSPPRRSATGRGAHGGGRGHAARGCR